MMKLERKFKREDIFTLDAETTANFKDKVKLDFKVLGKKLEGIF